ncbi:unnamed protein product, partial [Brassica rapa subsp. trilocularis]
RNLSTSGHRLTQMDFQLTCVGLMVGSLRKWNQIRQWICCTIQQRPHASISRTYECRVVRPNTSSILLKSIAKLSKRADIIRGYKNS